MSRKLRILLINDHFHFSGGGDAVLWLERRAYEEAGHEVYSFSQAPEVLSSVGSTDHVVVAGRSRVSSKLGKFLGAPGVSRSLGHVLRSIRPDVVRTHLISKYPLAIYNALKGQRVIQTLHGPSLFCASSWGNLKVDGSPCELGIGMKCYSRRCVSFSEALAYTQLNYRLQPAVKSSIELFHCPSIYIQKAAESLGYGPTLHIPLGVDPQFFAGELATHDGVPTIIYVGGLLESKGVQYLPEMLRRVRIDVPNARLIVCGRGPLRDRLETMFIESGVRESVEMKGFVGRDEIVSTYKAAHVMVCPSIYNEQFGLVGPEALACGVPCVASRVGGIPEWLSDGEWGRLVEPRDSVAISEAIVPLLKDRATRLKYGEKGREFVEATHSPRLYARRWIETIENFCQSGGWND
ncbi:glycosyltransferase family 4 protein [Arenimonas daejeonensis]|uniref:glycosyltransferase family 4 protein n=1 Tax=Arenimonas daejeonensis TaxID=370777 RepID=UPI0011BF12BB|nr:glycosyltransferase family 4 protein [Arenimonas daejeonensis]